MKSFLLFTTAVAAMFLSAEAFGQCQGGGGGARGGATAASGSTGTSATTASVGQLLTGPGSAYYDDMLQLQAMRAYQQQQYEIAAAKAAKTQARRDAIKASVIAYKQREAAKKGKFSPSQSGSRDTLASLSR